MPRRVGPASAPDEGDPDRTWETLVTEAVGNAIEFWGFKHNHGRVWALLYLRGTGLSASEVQEELRLSKGAVSMITRELEQWDVIHRVRASGSEPWRFEADTDLMAMVRRVLGTRESGLLDLIEEDLTEAERLARDSGDVEKQVIDRVARLKRLATMMHGALDLFLTTSRFDLGGAARLLASRGRERPAQKKR